MRRENKISYPQFIFVSTSCGSKTNPSPAENENAPTAVGALLHFCPLYTLKSKS